MGKVAFVFSGQGDQFPGMGKILYDRYQEARRVYEMCDQIRPNTTNQCFYGSPEELKDTMNTQPCLFAMEMAAAEVLKSNRILPDVVAGFSLGEVVACTFAGMVSMEKGFRLILERGRLMHEAARGTPSFMAAVLRLSGEQVKKLCLTVEGVYAVNYNCPGQTVVSGYKEKLDLFEEKVKAEGGRVIPLKVSGAFHSPLMENAAGLFREVLETVRFNEPEIKIYSNVTALPYQNDSKELLATQIKSPVRWIDLINNMTRSGVDTFVEVGPGRTLSGLIRRIDRAVRTYAISDLPTVLQEVRTC